MKVGTFDIHRPAAMSLRAQATWARLLLRFTMWAIIVVSVISLLAGVAAFFIVQTDWFQRWSAKKVEEILANELEAKVEFTALRVNIFKGIELDSVRLITRGDTVLSAASLTARYEIEPLLLRSIVVSGITLDAPVVRLLRSATDSTWNVEHIVKPKQDTTPAKPFEWGITLRDLTLRNGTVTVYDSLSGEPLPQRIHYTRTTLHNVNLSCSAILNIASQTYTAGINNFTFREERTGFSPREFRLAARVDTTALNILNLHIITDSTDLELDARFDSVNVFAGGKIERAPFRCSLNTPQLLARELNLFLPPTFSLKGMFDVDADVDGSINRMSIAARHVRIRSTDLQGTVVLDHLADGKPFTYTINLVQSVATYNEVRDALPTVVLPDIPFLRRVDFRKAHCFGIGDSLSCDVDATSTFGSLRGTARLGLRPLLEYDVDATVGDFDISALTMNGATASRLNGQIKARGKGTTLGDASAAASVNLNESSFAGRQFRSLASSLRIDSRTITLDTLHLAFPDAVMDSTDVVYDGEPRWLEARGTVDMNTQTMPVYSLALSLQHTPLASLVQTPTAPRLFSGAFTVQGTGFHPDSLSANLDASVDEFLLADRAIFPFSLKASVLRRDKDNRTVTLASEPADITLDGRFRLTTFGPVFLAQIEMIDKFIRKKASVMSSDTATVPMTFPYRLPEDTLDMRYIVRLRNLAPVAPFLQGVKINARADVSGSLRGSQACYELAVDTAYIPKFSMQIGSSFMISQPLRAHILLRTENMNTQPDLVQADVEVLCDSVFRVEQTRFVRPTLALRLVEGKTQFTASTRINNRMPLAVRGSLTLNESEYLLALDSLRFGLNRAFAFSSQRPVRATITPRGTMIHDLLMKHDSSRALFSAHGVLNSKRFDGMTVGIRNFSLRTLQRIPDVAGIAVLELLDGWVDSLDFNVRGPFTKPIFTLNGTM
ncbi:MAG: hypothetical protein JNL32_11355, partial [Candidatus Kapabacteria bacterium]|nr:hypothetical protein [Candidatus Kapabacteria bacterium]